MISVHFSYTFQLASIIHLLMNFHKITYLEHRYKRRKNKFLPILVGFDPSWGGEAQFFLTKSVRTLQFFRNAVNLKYKHQIWKIFPIFENFISHFHQMGREEQSIQIMKKSIVSIFLYYEVWSILKFCCWSPNGFRLQTYFFNGFRLQTHVFDSHLLRGGQWYQTK